MYSLPRTDRRRPHDLGPLLAVPSLRGADPRRLAALAPHTDRLRLPRGRTLASAGHVARELIAIVGGEATVRRADGGATVLQAGTEIGGDEVVRNERHRSTVVATSEVEVVVVHGPAVRWAHQEGLRRAPGPPLGRAGTSPPRRPDTDPPARLAS